MDYRTLGHFGLKVPLDASQMTRLDAASAVMPPYPYYPYWNGMFAERNPPPVPFTVPTESPA